MYVEIYIYIYIYSSPSKRRTVSLPIIRFKDRLEKGLKGFVFSWRLTFTFGQLSRRRYPLRVAIQASDGVDNRGRHEAWLAGKNSMEDF